MKRLLDSSVMFLRAVWGRFFAVPTSRTAEPEEGPSGHGWSWEWERALLIQRQSDLTNVLPAEKQMQELTSH